MLWAILSDAKLRDLSPEIQLAASRLLSPEELLKLSGYGVDEMGRQASQEIYQRAPLAVRRILEIEGRMRHMLTRSSASFRELERIAVLGGEPELGEGSLGIPWGRWSAHPGGFYVRYLPSGYDRTRIQVYLPADPEEDAAEFDPSSEIAVPANTASQRLGLSARAF